MFDNYHNLFLHYHLIIPNINPLWQYYFQKHLLLFLHLNYSIHLLLIQNQNYQYNYFSNLTQNNLLLKNIKVNWKLYLYLHLLTLMIPNLNLKKSKESFLEYNFQTNIQKYYYSVPSFLIQLITHYYFQVNLQSQ